MKEQKVVDVKRMDWFAGQQVQQEKCLDKKDWWRILIWGCPLS